MLLFYLFIFYFDFITISIIFYNKFCLYTSSNIILNFTKNNQQLVKIWKKTITNFKTTSNEIKHPNNDFYNLFNLNCLKIIDVQYI